MFVELGVIGAIGYGYERFKNRDVYNIKKQFNNVLQDNKLDFYKVIEIRKNNNYGYTIIVSLNGKGFKKLEDSKELIESKLGYFVSIELNTNLKTATLNVIANRLTDSTKFIPKKIKPWELYFGKTYTLQDVVISMKDLPHVIYTGINSSGKTYCVVTALTNLIYNCSERKIEIFLSQISAKKDLRKFKDVKQCRGYASTLQEAYKMFNYLYHTMGKRINMFNSIKDRFIDDIYEWNKNFPSRRMRIVYLAMDEFTAYMPDTLDSKEDAELKQQCLDLLVKLIQQCRACGIYVLTSLQRPDKESLPPRLKAQFNCKVSFKQPNLASSLTVCDSDKAYYLKPKREAIVNADQEYLMKTLYLDNDMINEFIEDSIDVTHKNYYNYNKLTSLIDTNENKELNGNNFAQAKKTQSDNIIKINTPTKKTKTKTKVKVKV